MTENVPPQSARTLAQIESDLLKAEAAFDDADARLNDAERDRRAALDTINRHQGEFDKAVSDLRQRSTAGSKWRLAMENPEDALILKKEDISEERSGSSLLKLESASEDFDRLKTFVQAVGNDRGR